MNEKVLYHLLHECGKILRWYNLSRSVVHLRGRTGEGSLSIDVLWNIEKKACVFTEEHGS